MNRNIDLDFSDVIEELELTGAQAEDMSKFVVQQLTTHILAHWQAQARIGLNSTREGYIKALGVVEEGRLQNAIVLTGKLNNMLESGAPPFDMKSGLLSSSKVKTDKKGQPYITVPFRHAVPSSLGESMSFSNNLPSEVHVAMGKLMASGRNTMRSGDLPEGHTSNSKRPTINRTESTNSYAEYEHKSPRYEGLTNSGGSGHSQYMTFRRISLASDALSWIHRGFAPRNFLEKAIEAADIGDSVDTFISHYEKTL